jgi:starch phosphorylase
MQQYFHRYAQQLGISMSELVALGRADADNPHEPFNMAHLALRGSGAINGVSRLHGEVSQGIFQPLFPRWPRRQVPVGHVTNGVHMPSWDSAPADALWTQACGKRRWLGSLDALQRQLERVSDAAFWTFRGQGRRALVEAVRSHLTRQGARRGADAASVADLAHWLDPNALTLGFARRFTGYKRVTLLLHDPQRLEHILTDRERPVQLVIAGKAHPRDTEGKRMVREWVEYMHRPRVRGRVVFLEDYDMGLASELVQGVDVWINTPRRPWEASGTSGMKVLVNGGLNLSELDGWWVEAYTPDVGWALSDGQEHGDDPGWDAMEAEQLYCLLEQEVIPTFYTRDEHGIPVAWVALMRASMARLTPRFSANRMVREYTEDYYLPGAEAYQRRIAEGGAVAQQIEEWHRAVAHQWGNLHFGKVEVQPAGDEYLFRVPVYLNEMDPGAVRVELYAEAPDGGMPLCQSMTPEEVLTGAVNGYLYTARVSADRPAAHYTPRIVPYHPDARIPLEASFIVWSR